MLVACPRCGFSQPNDQYCAKCGVDMSTYLPKPKPWLKRMVNHPVFYALIAALVAIVIVLEVKKRWENNGPGHGNNGRGGPVIGQNSPSRNLPNSGIPVASSSGAGTDPGAPAAQLLAGDAGQANPDSADLIKVQVYYAEVDHDTVEILRQESQSTQQYGDYGDLRSGALPAKSKAHKERGIRILDRVEKRFDRSHLAQQWFVGKKLNDQDEGLGISTALTLESLGAGRLHGELELTRIFLEGTENEEGPIRRSLPVLNFEVGPGMSWMVIPRLPTVAQEDANASAEGILRLFQSPQFKSRQTEFTLFFEFDTSTANSAK